MALKGKKIEWLSSIKRVNHNDKAHVTRKWHGTDGRLTHSNTLSQRLAKQIHVHVQHAHAICLSLLLLRGYSPKESWNQYFAVLPINETIHDFLLYEGGRPIHIVLSVSRL